MTSARYFLAILKNVLGVLVATLFYDFAEAVAKTTPDIAGLVIICLAAAVAGYFLIRIYEDRAKTYAALVAVLLLVIEGLSFYEFMWRQFGLDFSKSTDMLSGMLKQPGYLPGLLLQVFLPLLMVFVLDRFLKKGRVSSTHQESRA